MAFYTQDLYNKVIKKPAQYYDNLKIVSGFASSKFLKRVIKDFPDHKLCLIVDMASRGISVEDHKEFKRICTNSTNVEVFYYVGIPPNHMKVYQWYNGEAPGLSFVGSANFSEAGFLKHDEILSPIIDVFSSLIEEVLVQSISCLDERVESEIPLYEEKDYVEMVSEENPDIDFKLRGKKRYEVKRRSVGGSKNSIDLMKLLLKNIRLVAYHKVTIELILEDDPHWATRALNNWNRKHKDKSDSYIDMKGTNQLAVNKLDFFPRGKDIQLISDDNVEWIVKRVGGYGRELVVSDGVNFYEFFKKRLGISEDRVISYSDLLCYGRTNVEIYKLGESEYLLDFSLNQYG